MRRFDSAGIGGRWVDHPAGRHHGACSQRGILDRLLQRIDPTLDVCPLRNRSLSLLALCAGRDELINLLRERCDLAMEFCDALLHAVHEYVRLQGELLSPELR